MIKLTKLSETRENKYNDLRFTKLYYPNFHFWLVFQGVAKTTNISETVTVATPR